MDKALALALTTRSCRRLNQSEGRTRRYGHSGSPGWVNNTVVPMAGISNTIAEKVAQLRPPKIALANA